MRVVATVHLVDGDRNYRPGDVIVEGELYRLARYYAGLGHVRIDDASELDAGAEGNGEFQQMDDHLAEKTVAQLQAMARVRGIPYSGLRKAELVDALRGG
ncbi:MAG: hypothetical protein KatS3mg051_2135 [Anaerolineae bacterium]|nr:MAG: hypothetical protein KatS3mg051_2135 [Anaerolineae bacterium]